MAKVILRDNHGNSGEVGKDILYRSALSTEDMDDGSRSIKTRRNSDLQVIIDALNGHITNDSVPDLLEIAYEKVSIYLAEKLGDYIGRNNLTGEYIRYIIEACKLSKKENYKSAPFIVAKTIIQYYPNTLPATNDLELFELIVDMPRDIIDKRVRLAMMTQLIAYYVELAKLTRDKRRLGAQIQKYLDAYHELMDSFINVFTLITSDGSYKSEYQTRQVYGTLLEVLGVKDIIAPALWKIINTGDSTLFIPAASSDIYLIYYENQRYLLISKMLNAVQPDPESNVIVDIIFQNIGIPNPKGAWTREQTKLYNELGIYDPTGEFEAVTIEEPLEPAEPLEHGVSTVREPAELAISAEPLEPEVSTVKEPIGPLVSRSSPVKRPAETIYTPVSRPATIYAPTRPSISVPPVRPSTVSEVKSPTKPLVRPPVKSQERPLGTPKVRPPPTAVTQERPTTVVRPSTTPVITSQVRPTPVITSQARPTPVITSQARPSDTPVTLRRPSLKKGKEKEVSAIIPRVKVEELVQYAKLLISYKFDVVPLLGDNIVKASAKKGIERVVEDLDNGTADNIGIMTGRPSTAIVLDMSNDEWEHIKGSDIETLTVETDRGIQVYFQWDNTLVKLKNGKINGVTIYSEGSHVIAPGGYSADIQYIITKGYNHPSLDIIPIPDNIYTWLSNIEAFRK